MPMYATPAELGLLVRNEPFEPTDPAAVLALELASGVVEAYMGTVEAAEYTDDHLGTGSRSINLEHRPVLEVLEVAVNGVILDADDYMVSRSGVLIRPRRFARDAKVEVTYRAGWEPGSIPPVVRSITALAATRTYVNPESAGQETIGTYNVSMIPPTLTDAEQLMLDHAR